jgi:signal peptidase
MNQLVATAPTQARPNSARRFASACLTFSLWVVLGFGVGLVAIVTLPSVFGYKSLTVVSGSMEPTLGVGSVVIDEVISPLEARPGDIVTSRTR